MAMTNTIKCLVSKNKRRLIEDGFNLDLTYISDRVIAMGYPSENVESIYRNNLEDVKKLLEKRHKDHYKIYNLCSERSYDIQKFHNRVATYPFDDHNPPKFEQIHPFCLDVDRWLDEHESNVAVVHCKAGKGRTGLMICAYLLHRRQCTTSEDVLTYYGSKRTMDHKGVTIPSQRRYVDYYATMVREGLQYSPVVMYLTSIVIDPLPNLGMGIHEGYIQFEVSQSLVRPYLSDVYLVKRTDGRINIELQNALLIVGDVKIEFFQKIKLDFLNFTKGPKSFSNVPNGKLFHFWVNTYFMDLQRSSKLTHESTPSLNLSGRSVTAPTTTFNLLSSQGYSSVEETEQRNCRSTHNSGGGLGHDSPLPPPRMLRPTASVGEPVSTSCAESAATASTEEPKSGENSPSGSCLGSVQTIHCHPPARTLSIVSQQQQRVTQEQVTAELKGISISEDFLEGGSRRDAEATHESFIAKRSRHSSVPQTARSGQVVAATSSCSGGGLTAANSNTGQGGHQARCLPRGRLMSVRLNKSQIDKAAKDKSGKFSDKFSVTLFLVRPSDQTLCEGMEPPSSGPLPCSDPLGAGEGHARVAAQQSESSSDSSDDDLPPSPGPGSMPRNTHSHIHGMVRNFTEPRAGAPLNRLSDMALSQSTWI